MKMNHLKLVLLPLIGIAILSVLLQGCILEIACLYLL